MRPLLAATFFLQVACSGTQAIDLLNGVIPAIGYDLQSNVSYGSNPRHRMDIYVPSKPAQQAHTVLFVHGGAWREGNKEQYEFVGQSLSSAGYTVVIPNYRLYPSVVYPHFVEDVVAAIQTWTTLQSDSNEEETPVPIVLMGHSSGAHTAALLASDQSWLTDVNTAVTDLIALSGPYDLPLDNAEVKTVFPNIRDPSQVKPTELVDDCHPRTLLVHGTDDERVVIKHSETYAAALATAGIEGEFVKLEGGDHASTIAGMATPLSFANATNENVLRFLQNSRGLDGIRPACR